MTTFHRVSVLFALAILLGTAGCPSGSGHGGGMIPIDDAKPGDAGEDDTVTPKLCQNDADCPDAYCDPFSGVCVDCVINEHCGDGMVCDKWTCVPVQECEEDLDCTDGTVCDTAQGICVPCLTSDDCPGGTVCVNQVCLVSCLDGSPCPGETVCDPETNACVECLSDADCGAPRWCNLSQKLCYPDVCDPGDFACEGNAVVQCLDNGSGWSDPMPCPDGSACIGGTCVEGKICVPGLITCKDEVTIEECNGDGTVISEIPCPAGTTCVNGECTEECVPDCADKECGASGCPGYSCGSCPDGEHCQDFQCVAGACAEGETTCQWGMVVECWLGPDGLGTWGEPMPCPPGETCEDGACVPMADCGEISWLGCCEGNTLLYCEDGALSAQECSADGPCGWNDFGQFYDCDTKGEPEPSGTYPMECGGPCIPTCGGKDCGPDGCGGSCGQCGPQEECTPSGNCLGPDCFPGEAVCEGDLILVCGPDGTWHKQPCPPGTTCEDGECQFECTPNCANKDCGPDGCGGNCGSCPAGASCNIGGICVNTCEPECPDGVECGSNGCGGLCGVCDNDEACVDGECKTSLTCLEMQQCSWQCGWDEACSSQCWTDASVDAQLQWMAVMQCIVQVCGQPPAEGCWQSATGNGGECQEPFNTCQDCTPQCEGLQCGPDGCGGTCGACPAGYACDQHGYCLCAPACDGKECGPDGCGGQCGFCPSSDVCNYLGDCVCMPQCDGKECGGDGCGGSCGFCPPGSGCTPQGFCDAQQCPPGQVPDCSGKCAPPEWIGDGFCDNEASEFGANFYCAAFDWDGGDCELDNCGNQYCQESLGENCENCPQDCGPCGGECDQAGFVPDCNGQCRPEWLLGNGQCNNGTGGGPGGGANFNCPEWEFDFGDCDPEPWQCGDGWCDNDVGEDCQSCPMDCGPCGGECGDGLCDYDFGESCETCPWDCGECGSEDCCTAHPTAGCEDPEIVACVCEMDPFCCQANWDDICVNEAKEQCGMWWCGGDDCTMLCQEVGLECGDFQDCWCGDCPAGTQCLNGKCQGGEPICEMLCQMAECGVVGPCDCGGCPWGEECVQNQCQGGPSCDEICWNKQCGEFDGCWCGSCPPGAWCSDAGSCITDETGWSCQELVECAFDCGFGATCIFDCYSEGSETGQAQFQDLSLCVLQICGAPDPNCFQEAASGPCADAFQQCD